MMMNGPNGRRGFHVLRVRRSNLLHRLTCVCAGTVCVTGTMSYVTDITYKSQTVQVMIVMCYVIMCSCICQQVMTVVLCHKMFMCTCLQVMAAIYMPYVNILIGSNIR